MMKGVSMSVIPRSNEFNAGRQGRNCWSVCVAWALRSEAKKLRSWGANRGYDKFNMLTARGDRDRDPDQKRDS